MIAITTYMEVIMPLFEIFKKSPKKESAQISQHGSTRDETLLSPEMQKKRHEAATEFLKSFQYASEVMILMSSPLVRYINGLVPLYPR